MTSKKSQNTADDGKSAESQDSSAHALVNRLQTQTKALAVVDEETLKLFLNTAAPGLPPAEQIAFIQVAKAYNLDPFKREIYAVPYGQGDKRRLTIITGYEVYLKRAERTGLLDGWEATIEGEFEKYQTTRDIRKHDGTIWKKTVTAVRPKDGKPVVAKITIHRIDRAYPTVWEVDFDEYYQNNEMWDSKPRTMIKKVAIAQGFRLAFPDELGGMPYTSDELPDHMTHLDPEKEIVTTQATESQEPPQTTQSQQAGNPPPPPPPPPPQLTDEQRTAAYLKYMGDQAKRAGDIAVHRMVQFHGFTEVRAVPIAAMRKIMSEAKRLPDAPPPTTYEQQNDDLQVSFQNDIPEDETTALFMLGNELFDIIEASPQQLCEELVAKGVLRRGDPWWKVPENVLNDIAARADEFARGNGND